MVTWSLKKCLDGKRPKLDQHRQRREVVVIQNFDFSVVAEILWWDFLRHFEIVGMLEKERHATGNGGFGGDGVSFPVGVWANVEVNKTWTDVEFTEIRHCYVSEL
jgi:hypothetical protein